MKRSILLPLSAFIVLVCPQVTYAAEDATLSILNASRCNENIGSEKYYRGCQNRLPSGRTCQKWSSQYPHKHTRTPGKFPNANLIHNYCRNPDGSSYIWCYTTDRNKRWEYCNPICNEALSGKKQADYRGCQRFTPSARKCQMWSVQSPHKHTRTPGKYPNKGLIKNYCRNPDNSQKIWCYTLDTNKRWEYCKAQPKPKPKPARCNENYRAETDYRGCQIRTSSGRTCQKWSSQYPHKHTRTPVKYHQADLVQNYCRNPDGSSYIWCYTTDRSKRWEYCNPKCNEKLGGERQTGYRGCQRFTPSARKCQMWSVQSPHKHTRTPGKYPNTGLIKNYCRNPDNSQKIWCYTLDKNKRWEYCNAQPTPKPTPKPTPRPRPTPKPTPKPTPIKGGGWVVAPKSGKCKIDDRVPGRPCLLSPNFPHEYKAEDNCTVKLGGKTSHVVFERFRTEKFFDYVTINSHRYSGVMKDKEVVEVGKSKFLTWSSDFFEEAKGWTICKAKPPKLQIGKKGKNKADLGLFVEEIA